MTFNRFMSLIGAYVIVGFLTYGLETNQSLHDPCYRAPHETRYDLKCEWTQIYPEGGNIVFAMFWPIGYGGRIAVYITR